MLDFQDVPQGSSATFGDFATTFSGGTYVYDSDHILSDFTDKSWRITGTVTQASGFGVFFHCKVDASKFEGVAFDIAGTFASLGSGNGAAPPVTLTMKVESAPDLVASQFTSAYLTATDKTNPAAYSWGTCVPGSAQDGGVPSQSDESCSSPSHQVVLTPSMTSVAVAWTDLANGKPEPSPDPTQLVGFSRQLPWDAAAGAPYSVEIMLDNLQFLTR